MPITNTLNMVDKTCVAPVDCLMITQVVAGYDRTPLGKRGIRASIIQ